MDTNFKQSSAYRRYNKSIPYYLRNLAITHCMKSSFAAREFCNKDVECINNNSGKFCVRSSNDKKLRYKVDFSVPMCGCESWRKTQFPCKHFYTVFNTFGEWQFTSLPNDYTNSVFITLDTNTDVKTNCEKRKMDQKAGSQDLKLLLFK
jgi:hypothetical protein